MEPMDTYLPWVDHEDMGLLVDQYELTMLRAYRAETFVMNQVHLQTVLASKAARAKAAAGAGTR
jgi:nicotinic acid phosphoribosyltransferase